MPAVTKASAAACLRWRPTTGKIKVEGVGMIKRHQKANPQSNRGGGIIEKEAFINISNVQLIDPQSGKPTRVRYQVEATAPRSRGGGQRTFVGEVRQ